MLPPNGLVEPTSSHATFECPHCGVLSIHQKVQVVAGPTDERGIKTGPGTLFYHAQCQHYVVRCVHCQKDTYFFYRPNFLNSGKTLPQLPTAELLHQYPVSTPTSHPAVCEGVKSAALEAEKCLNVGAYNACAVMTRRAIHSLCDDKNAEGKDLFAQLKDLKSKQVITPDLYEWADSLRILGRDGAHPEFPEVPAEDAEEGVKLLREIIKYVYILPFERAEKRKAK